MSEATTAKTNSGDEPGWLLNTWRAYKRPSMAAMVLLGFASGLPLYMVYQKTSAWLRIEGIDRTTIGFFYWVGLFYSFKFLWAPIIDKLKLGPLTASLGHRRGWMLASIAGTMLGLFIMATADPSEGLMPLAVGALLLAFSGATLDISIDAWRIESAPTDLQANMAAAYSLGYRFAYIYSGLGLVIADFTNWNFSYVVMALSMGLTGALILLVKEPPRPEGALLKRNDPPLLAARKLFAEPFLQIKDRFGIVLIPLLALVFVYRLSDFTMGVMASPLYVDLGYAPAVFGGLQSGPGVIATFTGLFLGGIAAANLGLMRTLVIGSVLTLITNGGYAWFAHVATGEDPLLLAFAICADNVAGGFVVTVFIAYLSSLVDPAHAATQYALFSSLYAFVNKFVAGFSGAMADALGWEWFFIVTASYAIPAGLLVILVGIMMRRYPPKEFAITSGAPA